MKKYFVAIFIFLNSISAFASIGGNLPDGLPSVDDLIRLFRAQFESKIKLLSENYITKISRNSLTFTSHEDKECAWRMIPARNPLTKIILASNQSSSNRLHESIKYIDCWSTENLIETETIKGTDLSPRSIQDVAKGERSFSLRENETSRLYRLSNEDREEIFSYQIRRKPDGLLAFFKIREQNFLTVRLIKDNDLRKYIYTFSGYHYQYKRKFRSWESHYGIDTWKALVYDYDGTGDRRKETLYRTEQGRRLSQKSFVEKFNETVSSITLNNIKGMIEYHMYGYPTTDVVQSGVPNRFLDEMRLNFIRLQNGNPAELELVKNLIQGYIEAIEKKELIIDDRRPTE